MQCHWCAESPPCSSALLPWSGYWRGPTPRDLESLVSWLAFCSLPAMSLRSIILLCAAVLIAGAVIAGACHAQSGERGDGHAEQHDWYRHLEMPSGGSCCNGDQEHGDCRPVRAFFDGKHWRAFYGDRWQVVPDEAILSDALNLQPLRAHICERGGYVFCFLKGAGGT